VRLVLSVLVLAVVVGMLVSLVPPPARDPVRPFRVSCPACRRELTVYPPRETRDGSRVPIDFGRAKKTATDEVPR
jgi:hypothetical protein